MASFTLEGDEVRVGSIGKRDEGGYFYIVDRMKDLIIRGGMNIYPREIEEVLYQHPKVLEAFALRVTPGKGF